MESIFTVCDTDQYDRTEYGTYTDIEDAKIHLAILEKGDSSYTSYEIHEEYMNVDLEKLRNGYHTFTFSRTVTDLGVEVTILEAPHMFKENFHVSFYHRAYEAVQLLAPDMETAKAVFYTERERLIKLQRETHLKYREEGSDVIQLFDECIIPVDGKDYYAGQEGAMMDTSLGSLINL